MKFEARIELECWNGPENERVLLTDSNLQTLRSAFARLDGDRTDSLWIQIEEAGELSIGGGPDNFVVISFPSDGSSSHVVAGDDDGSTVELQVGGQTGVYPKAMVTNAERALAIAETFLLSGLYEPAVHWVEDCPPQSN